MPDGGFRLIAKILLSLLIVFHVFVFTVMPLGPSYVARALEPWIVPYASTLGMNASWNFFSPDPAHTMYLKFTVFYPDTDEGESPEPQEIYMPDAKGQGVWDLGKKRALYAMRYMIIYPNRLEAVLGPYLCRRHSGAEAVKIEHIIDPIPVLDLVARDRRELHELGEEKYEYINRTYRCSQMDDEVDL